MIMITFFLSILSLLASQFHTQQTYSFTNVSWNLEQQLITVSHDEHATPYMYI